MHELASRQVSIVDPFWSPRLEVNAGRALRHQWTQLEASGCIDNFRIAAGEKDGFREGWFFADSDAYKWLEAAARASVHFPDPELGTVMDGFLAQLGRAQAPDGYLFTYNQIHFPGVRWTDLQVEHELYCHGHLIEAGVAHAEATGRPEGLALARRAADLLVRDFLGRGPERTPGHEEVELALERLYQACGESAYLDLAHHFLEQRGRTPRFGLAVLRQTLDSARRGALVRRQRAAYIKFHPEHKHFTLPPRNPAKEPPTAGLRWLAGALSGRYFQQNAPLRAQDVPVGHAVRFGYLQAATARLHRLRPDPSLLPALERSWERMVARRMYVTGGLGALPGLEGFGRDDELDPEVAYAETCAALAGMFWDWEMALATGEAKYADLFEWQLYNAASVGMGLSGESYLYNNPLACRGNVTRLPWYDVPCCPSNLSRTWADLGKYVFSMDNGELWVHQYLGCRATLTAGGPPEAELVSGLPFDGHAALRLGRSGAQTIHLRIPSWSAGTGVRVNGAPLAVPPAAEFPPTAGGTDPRPARWLVIRREWAAGDTVELDFDMRLRLRCAGPGVRGHAGKAALTRGPLVYCLESVDNPGVDLFACRLDSATLRPEPAPELLGGVTVLRGTTVDGRPLTFIPYTLWANRGPSKMNVWIKTAPPGNTG